jgi:hypothetical protein
LLSQAKLLTRSLIISLEDRSRSLHDLVNVASERESAIVFQHYSKLVREALKFIATPVSDVGSISKAGSQALYLLAQTLLMENKFLQRFGQTEQNDLKDHISDSREVLTLLEKYLSLLDNSLQQWQRNQDDFIQARFQARKTLWTRFFGSFEAKKVEVTEARLHDRDRFDRETAIFNENFDKAAKLGPQVLSQLHTLSLNRQSLGDLSDCNQPYHELAKLESELVKISLVALPPNFFNSNLKLKFENSLDPVVELFLKKPWFPKVDRVSVTIDGSGAEFSDGSNAVFFSDSSLKIKTKNWQGWNLRFEGVVFNKEVVVCTLDKFVFSWYGLGSSCKHCGKRKDQHV